MRLKVMLNATFPSETNIIITCALCQQDVIWCIEHRLGLPLVGRIPVKEYTLSFPKMKCSCWSLYWQTNYRYFRFTTLTFYTFLSLQQSRNNDLPDFLQISFLPRTSFYFIYLFFFTWWRDCKVTKIMRLSNKILPNTICSIRRTIRSSCLWPAYQEASPSRLMFAHRTELQTSVVVVKVAVCAGAECGCWVVTETD